MAIDVDAQAKALLRAQSEVLSRYAAAVEDEVRNNPDQRAPRREQLTRRAELARDMAGVMFRAATHETDDANAPSDDTSSEAEYAGDT